jgi:hypothetical protein
MRKTTTLLAITALLASGCGGGDGDDAVAEDSAADTAEVDIVDSAEETSAVEQAADLSELSDAVAALEEKIDALSDHFVTNDDGSSSFAPADAVEVVSENRYGFTFPLPAGTEAEFGGISDDEATNDSGTLIASSGGVSVLLLWLTNEDPLSPSESVVSSFEVLQDSTALDFSLLGAGADSFTVDEQDAAYATFTASDTDTEETVGVAVIGGWTCEALGRSFALTVTGTDQDSVSTSFFELVNGFACGS